MLLKEYIDKYTAGRCNLLKFICEPLDDQNNPMHLNEMQRKKLFLIVEHYNVIIDWLHEWQHHVTYPVEPKIYLTGTEFLMSRISIEAS